MYTVLLTEFIQNWKNSKFMCLKHEKHKDFSKAFLLQYIIIPRH